MNRVPGFQNPPVDAEKIRENRRSEMQPYVIPFQSLGIADIEQVGGKNASLGEMIGNLSASGVCVPGGFATTADAYRDFLKNNGLEQRIKKTLEALDVDDVTALARAGAD